MRNTLTIFRKELQSYFASPIAYWVLGFFALLAGFFFYSGVTYFVQRSVQMQMTGRSMPMDVNEMVIRPLLMNTAVIALFVVPAITMRLFAEEKRSGTIELLLTSPVRDIEIILGKWMAALVLWSYMLLLSGLSIASLYFYGQPDLRPILTGYLGLLLFGAALLAVGTFISTVTKNQVIAAVAGFGTMLMLWALDWPSAADPSSTWAKVLAYVSVVGHLEPFSKGVIDTKDLVFFCSLTFLGLFLSARSMESLRWRG
ncbi:MAG TPA: ABC transporter permease subunit [Bryobacteraceae bacterium]|nr:ABC transporter permease subunit [Bryobacteraceae bacterium]